MICLGVDFGTFSWGVAIGDQLSETTQSIGAVRAEYGKPVWADLDDIIEKWNPECIVLGYPLKADGSRFKLTDRVDKAKVHLEKRYPTLPIYLTDERLTTVIAREKLFAEKGKKGLEKGSIDAESARLILEHWFESGSIDL